MKVVKREPANVRSKSPGGYKHRDCGKSFGACKQEFASAADINFIVKRYQTTGVLDALKKGPVEFGEDSGFRTYADAHRALESAKEKFLLLPPELRLELGNDPGRYRELSTREGVEGVLNRMSERGRRRLQDAMRLVRAHQPPSPASSSSGGGAPSPGGSSPPSAGTRPAPAGG